MRRLTLKMSMTLDGYVAGPEGEMDWAVPHRAPGRQSVGRADPRRSGRARAGAAPLHPVRRLLADLRGPARDGAAKKLGDDLAGLLPTLVRDLLQPLGVVAFDTDQDRELRVRVSRVDFDLLGPRLVELGVEVAWLGISVGPRFLCHLNRGFYARGQWIPNR